MGLEGGVGRRVNRGSFLESMGERGGRGRRERALEVESGGGRGEEVRRQVDD